MPNRRALVIPAVIGLLAFGAGTLAGSTFGTATVSAAATNSIPSGAVAASAPNLVVNGNFSRPAQVKDSYETVYPSAEKIPGWTVGGDSVDLMGSTYFTLPSASSSGSQAVDLSGSAPGSLTQTISTTPGTSYALTWYEAGNPDCGQSLKVMHVAWGNKPLAKLIASPSMSTKGRTRSSMGWSQESQTVVASSALSVLGFADATPDQSACGPVVADVSLTAGQSSSPSPSSGGSLLTGTGRPTGTCTTGDAYIDLTTGEVYHCTSLYVWTDAGDCSAPPYPGIDLAGCDLTKSDSLGVIVPSKIELEGGDLDQAVLSYLDLEGTDLQGADFVYALMKGARLTEAKLTEANLAYADLRFANLTRANLTDADLTNTDLTLANLTDADLTRADLARADLDETNLTRANLTDANLTGVTWHNTTCPDGTYSDRDGGTCSGHLGS